MFVKMQVYTIIDHMYRKGLYLFVRGQVFHMCGKELFSCCKRASLQNSIMRVERGY